MKKTSKTLFLLDFDGTLSPIVDDLHKAVLPPRTKQWLKKMQKQKDIKVAIVTGRSLSDIRKRVGMKGIIYAANHGMEIEVGGRLVLNKGKKFFKAIAEIEKKIIQAVASVSGVIVEMKGSSLSVHYRKVKSVARQRWVIARTRRALRGQLQKNGLQLTRGKMVLEVRPRQYWHKGKAVLWIWRHYAVGHLPIYIGDDVTDEDAFSALRSRGITILVGKPRKTAAQYRMRLFSTRTLRAILSPHFTI